MLPQEDLAVQLLLFHGTRNDLRRSEIKNLVNMFEGFKHSQNLKAWLRFALQRLQSSCEAWEKRFCVSPVWAIVCIVTFAQTD